MRKRILTIGLAMLMATSLVACSDNGKKIESRKEVSKKTEATADESKTGEIVEEDGMKKVPVITDKKLNKKGKTGPIKYNIKAIQVSEFTATTDDMANALDIEKNKEYTLVAMDVSFENTSEKTICFYPDQGEITTNTKEQVAADMFFSDSVGGDFIGNVRKEGTLFFVLKKTNANDIDTISYHVDAPSNEDFESVGDNLEVELNFE